MGIPHKTNMRSLNWNVSLNSIAFNAMILVATLRKCSIHKIQPNIVLEFDARLLLLLTISQNDRHKYIPMANVGKNASPQPYLTFEIKKTDSKVGNKCRHIII